jgi:hypothetical protein
LEETKWHSSVFRLAAGNARKRLESEAARLAYIVETNYIFSEMKGAGGDHDRVSRHVAKVKNTNNSDLLLSRNQ